MKLLVIRNSTLSHDANPDSIIVSFQDAASWLKSGYFFRSIFRYAEVEVFTYSINTLEKPFLTTLYFRFLSRGRCAIQDDFGRIEEVTFSSLLGKFLTFVRDGATHVFFLRRIQRTLEKDGAGLRRASPALDLSKRPIYLRTDLWFGIRSGGSIGHIAGVLNNLDQFTGMPLLFTTDNIPTIRDDISSYTVLPSERWWNLKQLPSIAFSETLVSRALALLNGMSVGFIYQRYSVNNYAGIELSRRLEVPFVLEYNGSEVWMNRNWGKPLKYEKLSERIELLNLHAADVVVVVSRPMQIELIARGIDAEKILVNPNGVEPDRYSPELDGSPIRQKFGMSGKIVIGFIGTFGKWHGAEVLAEAFGLLLDKYPGYRQSVRLLMIGDGVTMPEVKANLNKWKITDFCILTGTVSQDEGPEHLAACDILASPHVPNPDGTPFFGSPTKLFEYMAMGKGIVASDLDQVGEILDHERTAWMVEPGSAESLAEGLKVLIDDPALRQRLGAAARDEVVAKYTWREHTGRIIEKLRERCPEA